MSLGAFYFLKKPLQLDELLSAARLVLDRTHAQGELFRNATARERD